LLEGAGNRLVEPAVASQAEGVPDGKVMIPEDRENPQRGLQAALRAGHIVDVVITFVDKITCKGDQIGLVGQRSLNNFGQVVRR